MTAALLLLCLLLVLMGTQLAQQVQQSLVQLQLVWLLAWMRCQEMMAPGLWSLLQAPLAPTAHLLQS